MKIVEGVLTLVLLSRDVRCGITHNLEGEKDFSPTFCHTGSLQLSMVGAQKEKGVESRVEACRGCPKIHAAAPHDKGEENIAKGTPERGPQRGHLPSPSEGLRVWRWVGEKVRRVMSGSTGGTGRVPEDSFGSPQISQKSKSVCV